MPGVYTLHLHFFRRKSITVVTDNHNTVDIFNVLVKDKSHRISVRELNNRYAHYLEKRE